MYRFKVFFIFIIIILLNACKNDTPRVFVGLEMVEEHSITGEKMISSVDHMMALHQDSFEFIPLWQGCILSPARKHKLKLYKDNEFGDYVVAEEDTVDMNFHYMGSNTYRRIEGKYDVHYIPALDIRLDLDFVALDKMIAGGSFRFSANNAKYIASFYEDHTLILKKQTKEATYIHRRLWFIEQIEDYFFLIIDDDYKILKFQIAGLSDQNIRTYDLNNQERKKVLFSKFDYNHSLFNNELWTVEASLEEQTDPVNPHFSASWLTQHDAFRTSTTLRYPETENDITPHVYIDWNSNVIIAKYNTVLNFEVDVLDGHRIKLFPTDEDGKVNRRISESYYLKKTPT